MNKKLLSIITGTAVFTCLGGNAFAMTPQIHIDMPEISNIGNIKLPDSVTQSIQQSVNDVLKEHPLELTTSITEAKYIHGNTSWNKSRLQIRWRDVEKAEKYEVKITDKTGSETIYDAYSNSLFLYGEECKRGCKVSVRAVRSDGKTGVWSASETISCNALHR